LPALFFAKMFYYIINKNVSNLLLQYSLFILLFWLSFQLPLELPFALNNAMNSVLWLFIGSQLFALLNREHNASLYTVTLLFSLGLLIATYVYWGIPKLDMSLLTYGYKIINVLWAVSLVLLLALFFKALPGEYVKSRKVRLVDQWGGGTMMLFIFHPYTNNISHLLVGKLHFGGWPLKLLISLMLLQTLLMIKQRFNNQWIFKYV